MKNQALFSLKDKSKKLKCRLLQFLFGALRIKSFKYHDCFSGFVSRVFYFVNIKYGICLYFSATLYQILVLYGCSWLLLTLKGPIMTASDNIYKYFFIVFQRK